MWAARLFLSCLALCLSMPDRAGAVPPGIAPDIAPDIAEAGSVEAIATATTHPA